jgi:hypothetical protein
MYIFYSKYILDFQYIFNKSIYDPQYLENKYVSTIYKYLYYLGLHICIFLSKNFLHYYNKWNIHGYIFLSHAITTTSS